MGKLLDFELSGGDKAPHEARAMISESIGGSVAPPTVDNVRLLVSELVTNAVVHGGASSEQSIRIRSSLVGTGIRTEVCHAGPSFIPPREPSLLETPGGLGLVLVEAISDAWGIHQNGETCVWFELE